MRLLPLAVVFACRAPSVAPAAVQPEVLGASATFDLVVTIDDLPWAGPTHPEGKRAATEMLIGHIKKRGVPAVGFVNCDKSDQELLSLWRDAGLELANHQAAHADIDEVPIEQWIDGARTCNETLSAAAPVRYFRYPYLRNGAERGLRDQGRRAVVQDLGLQVARVTVDNHEWKLAFMYGERLQAGDRQAADLIAQAYVKHLVDATRHFRALSQEKLGRDVSHILLLHANALAADHLDDALDALSREGARFVSLEQAIQDPVYAMEDLYVGRGGVSWLYRIDPLTQQWSWDDQAWQEVIVPLESVGKAEP